ncbi:MAG TPA: hypothetical protein H9745_06005 [Candidatus Agathobaculum stercoravium]|nr:hypothetical protein [Candidatus Agathobaculum stercoravium]
MSIRDLKITPQQIAEKGVIASPDTLTGTPDENKNVFDRLASEIIVPSVNSAIEMLGDVEDDTTEWAADEAQRQANETARQTAEQGRVQAENGRASAETARAQAENARVSAEQGRASAETARVQAEQGRASAETGRVSAEQGRVSAESGRVIAEQQRAAAEDDREDAEDARELAEQQRADETAGIVAQATAQAEAAEDSATLARSWAAGGTGTRSGEDTDNAEYYAGQAGTAAAAALQDAQNAENSAGAASDSADAAAASALAASQDAGSALDSKDAAESAADRAEQAAADAEAIAGGDFIPSSQKGVANGVATLDSSGKVPEGQLPAMADTIAATLTASGWSSNSQTVMVDGISADADGQLIIPVPDEDSADAYYNAGVKCVSQAANSLTFTCDAKPNEDIALYVMVSSVGNTAGGGGTSGPVLPTPATGDAGKVPTVNDTEDGYELKTPSGGGGTGGTVSVEVASTTTGEPGTDASVTNSGTNTEVKLNFTIPRGATGATGATPNLQVGEVTTLDAGSDATASITGTPENPLLNLGIPKGADGAGGSGGFGLPLLYDLTTEQEVRWIDTGDNAFSANYFVIVELIAVATETNTQDYSGCCSMYPIASGVAVSPWNNYAIARSVSGLLPKDNSKVFRAFCFRGADGNWSSIYSIRTQVKDSANTASMQTSANDGITNQPMRGIIIGDGSAASGTRVLGIGSQLKVWGI